MPARPPEPEDGYREVVQRLLVLHGFAVVHFRPAQNRRGQWSTPGEGDAEGWPDVVAFWPGSLVAVETKSDRGRLTADQRLWLGRFAALPCAYAWVLRPRDGTDAVQGWLRWIKGKGSAAVEPPRTYGWDAGAAGAKGG